MARKKQSKSASRRVRPVVSTSRWKLADNEYVGIVAILALFVIAAIVLKGPSLLQGGDDTVVGQAYIAAPEGSADDGVDHEPPIYVPVEQAKPAPKVDAEKDEDKVSLTTLPLTECVDTDGDDILTRGFARKTDNIMLDDMCDGRYMIREAVCEEDTPAYTRSQKCPEGTFCQRGECK